VRTSGFQWFAGETVPIWASVQENEEGERNERKGALAGDWENSFEIQEDVWGVSDYETRD